MGRECHTSHCNFPIVQWGLTSNSTDPSETSCWSNLWAQPFPAEERQFFACQAWVPDLPLLLVQWCPPIPLSQWELLCPVLAKRLCNYSQTGRNTGVTLLGLSVCSNTTGEQQIGQSHIKVKSKVLAKLNADSNITAILTKSVKLSSVWFPLTKSWARVWQKAINI